VTGLRLCGLQSIAEQGRLVERFLDRECQEFRV
jgi:hypothetical protein